MVGKCDNKVDMIQWWQDSPDAVPATQPMLTITCSPLGISSLVYNTVSSVLRAWPPTACDSNMSTEPGLYSDSELDSSLQSELEELRA